MLPRPRAIVVVSAHHDADPTQITGAARPQTIHDFGGFPGALYEISYPAPGEPDLARRIHVLLANHAIAAQVDAGRGFDHGAWIPLHLMFPEADLPLVQVSIESARSPEHHLELGRALRVLRDDGVLVIGSGGATHNLGLYFRSAERETPPEWVEEFNEWTAAAMAERRFDDLLRYRSIAPHSVQNHPGPEHYLPIFAAAGASFDTEAGVRVHRSYDRGLLSLDCYAFGFDA